MSDQPRGTGVVVDPYRSYNFKLEIRGITEAHFIACSGLGVCIQTIRYREAGTGQIVRAIPGAVEYTDVVLQYGMTGSRQLWDWLTRTAQGQVERQNVSVVVLAPNGSDEGVRWNLINAFPCDWRPTPFEAMGRDIGIEQLTLAYDTLERA